MISNPNNYEPEFFFSGFGTPPCGTQTTSFSLAPGQSFTLNLEVVHRLRPNNGTGPGLQLLKAILYNGSCSDPTDPGDTCNKSDSPFNSIAPTTSGAPEAIGTFTNTYGARSPVSFSLLGFPTTPVPEGYQIEPIAVLKAASDPYGIAPHPDRNIDVFGRRSQWRARVVTLVKLTSSVPQD